jgi:hypothetical protein
MALREIIEGWQSKARHIRPPEDTGILPVRGGLSGAAFFPEGLGSQTLDGEKFPETIAIGHNFGCENYRDEIDAAGREDDKATWRNLEQMLLDADPEFGISSCYLTNWYIGLKPGKEQVGEFLLRPDERFEADCRSLLLEQIAGIKPRLILLLGLPVVKRAHEIMPALRPWSMCSSWSEVDACDIGPVVSSVEIPEIAARADIVALVHPSFSPSNQRHRRTKFPLPKPEVAMIRRALERSKRH